MEHGDRSGSCDNVGSVLKNLNRHLESGSCSAGLNVSEINAVWYS